MAGNKLTKKELEVLDKVFTMANWCLDHHSQKEWELTNTQVKMIYDLWDRLTKEDE